MQTSPKVSDEASEMRTRAGFQPALSGRRPAQEFVFIRRGSMTTESHLPSSPSRRTAASLALSSFAAAILPGCATSSRKTSEQPPRRQVDLTQLGPEDVLHMYMARRLSRVPPKGNVVPIKAQLANSFSIPWRTEIDVMRRTGASQAQMDLASAQHFDKVFGEAAARWMAVDYRYSGKLDGAIFDASMKFYSAGVLNVQVGVTPFAGLERAVSSNGPMQVIKTVQRRQIAAFTDVYEISIRDTNTPRLLLEREALISLKVPYDQSKLKTLIEEKVRRGGNPRIRVSGHIDATLEPSMNEFAALQFGVARPVELAEVSIT